MIFLGTKKKDPDATVDFGIDWSSWLIGSETISTSVWAVGAGLTEGSKAMGDTSTTIWLSGGTAGETYTVANKITTSAGRIDERSIAIVVENR